MDEMEGYSVEQVLAATAGETFKTLVMIGDAYQRLRFRIQSTPGCPGPRRTPVKAWRGRCTSCAFSTLGAR
eukprot:432240-Lingulodinium_polyedra.AAC.1